MHVTPNLDDIDQIVRAHSPLVRHALRRHGVQERDIADACQDVFVVVHRRLPSFEGRASLSTWIYRIAFYVASEHRRRAYHRRELLVDAPDTGSHNDDHERQRLVERAMHALDTIDADKRQVFIAFELDETPMATIAQRLNIPVKTAFSRLYAARRELSRRMRDSSFAFWFSDRAPRHIARHFTRYFAIVTSTFATWLLIPSMQGVETQRAPQAQQAAMHRAIEVPSVHSPSTFTDTLAPPTAPTRAASTRARRPPRQPTIDTADHMTLATAIDMDAARDDLIVFHDSEHVTTPRLAPPLQAELPPAAAREPRVQLRGARDANWKLVSSLAAHR